MGSAHGYVSDILARRNETQQAVIARLDALGWTQDEIGKAVNITQGRVAQKLLEISELKKLVNENCSTKAAMQFLRIPYWEVDAENIRLGDLRFERRNRNASFSQLSFPRSTGSECPPYLTNWLPPRSDILLE
jgi:hypothetical protein